MCVCVCVCVRDCVRMCEQECPRTCAFVGTDMDKPTQILKTSKVQEGISVCVFMQLCACI